MFGIPSLGRLGEVSFFHVTLAPQTRRRKGPLMESPRIWKEAPLHFFEWQEDSGPQPPGACPGIQNSLLQKGFHGANSSRAQLVSRKEHHQGRGDTEAEAPRKRVYVWAGGERPVCQGMATVSLPTPQLPPSSEEALRSLPAPNCGSARPPRAAAPCSQGNTAAREGTSCILPLPASPGPARDGAEPTQTPAAIFLAGPWSMRPHRKGAEVNRNKPWVTSARDLLAENLGSCPERRK